MWRSRRRRRVRIAALIVAGLLVGGLWGAGLVRFAGAIPVDVTDRVSHTDAIVVLTGGSERLATGLQLLDENRAERVFISGVHPTVDVVHLVKLAGRPDSDLQSRIEAGHGALDTQGNAAETAAWMRGHGYRSLRLVTGSYHMPRSLLEFRTALPEAKIVPHPVFPPRVKQTTWWLQPGTAALIIGEYNKYLLASVEHWAGRLLLAEAPPRGFG